MMQTQAPGSLHADLVELLQVTRAAERDLFAMLGHDVRDAVGTIGEWSAKDLLGHIAAWRAIEARRLEATARGEAFPADDPAPNEPIDDANAHLHTRRQGWTWEAVDREADASVEALVGAIGLSSHDVLCECDGTVAGIGANGANHALAHLSDVALLGGGQQRFDTFVHEVEAILARRHLRPRDSGVMLYNIACHHTLSGELDEARRLLRLALRLHPELIASARDDDDLAALRDEIPALAER
jgi:hypothetical protein